MRVLYSFPHTLGKPGIATTAYHQIEGLIEQGVTVDVVCTSAQREVRGARRVIETLVVGGRRVPHRVLGVQRAYAYHDRRAARTLARLRGEVDLVHTWPAACLRTLGAARQHGVPGFREVPSAHTQTAYEDAAREAAAVGVELPPHHHHRYDARELERELREFAAADYLLVPSPYVERTFVERGHPSEQLIRHRYGFDPAAFAVSDEIASSDRDGLTAVFVGRGEPNKGLHHALAAWVDSGAAERGTLLVCGALLPEYRERIAPLLAHPSVVELGFVEDVAGVMRDADLLLLPSLTEGSALVTYEAQAVGCALLVSEAAGAPCDHLEQGLVHAPGDVAALTEHLRRVDRDRQFLLGLRRAALENAKTLTWAAAGERLVDAYARGLERSAVSRIGVRSARRVRKGQVAQPMARVDVVVVSYNSRDRLRSCVEPLLLLPEVTVIVVDNASPDASLEAVDDLSLKAIQLRRNGGFAHGVNAGWRAGTGRYVLLLNPDARIDGDSLRALVDVLDEESSVGAAAPRIVHTDGSLDHSQRRYPRLRSTYARAFFLHRLFPEASWTDELVRDEEAYARRGTPDWVSGACILVRRAALEELGGLDEGFFMYAEDIDLCRRLRSSGYELVFEPAAVVEHEGGASAPRANLLPSLAASRLRYASKHWNRAAAFLERVGIALEAATHVAVSRGGMAPRKGHARALLTVTRPRQT